MIQRIQTIFLFLAAAALFGQFALPYIIAPVGSAARNVEQLSDGMLNPMDNVGLLGLSVLGGLVCLIAIFLFRKSQIKTQGMLAGGAILVSIFLLVLIGVVGKSTLDAVPEGGVTSFGFGGALPALAILFEWLAMRNIRKDSALYHSADRLR
ncbi:MAG: DUF4293 family protein [Saprospiraceae bacterium]